VRPNPSLPGLLGELEGKECVSAPGLHRAGPLVVSCLWRRDRVARRVALRRRPLTTPASGLPKAAAGGGPRGGPLLIGLRRIVAELPDAAPGEARQRLAFAGELP